MFCYGTLRSALSWDHSYHYMPLTASWLWLQYQVFGLHEAAYQVLNVIQHGIMGWLVFLLGRRLRSQWNVALIAAVLYIAAGSAYQVVLWSVVGNNYFVSGDHSGVWRHAIGRVPALPQATPFYFFVRNKSRVPLEIARFGFLPVRHAYSWKTTPELVWNEERGIEISPDTGLIFPLAESRNSVCMLVYLDCNGHDFEVFLPGGERKVFTPTGTTGRKWRKMILKEGNWRAGSISIFATGKAPAMIRRFQSLRAGDLSGEGGTDFEKSGETGLKES